MTLKVLLVEDDHDLAASVCEYLALKGVCVEHADNGQTGFTLACEQQYDVLLLDIMLPRMDGLVLCQTLRAQGAHTQNSDTPVLILTARDSLEDKLAGFDAGGDDYLVKPFELEELVVRIKALSRWHSGQMSKLQVADLTLDLSLLVAKRGGHTLKLTPSGCVLLETLMRASPAVVSKQQLEQALWPDELPDSNALKVHMYHLRKQVDKPFEHALIHTLSGKGFVLKEDIDVER